MSDQLQNLREQIDQWDSELLIVLARRMELVKQVGEYKQQHSLPPLDQSRWAEVKQARLAQASELGLDTALTHEILETIHEHALRLEAKND